MIESLTVIVNGYRGVALEDARQLLAGENLYELERDPIRNKGPNGYIYPWNVLDYLDEDLKLAEKRRRQREARLGNNPSTQPREAQ